MRDGQDYAANDRDEAVGKNAVVQVHKSAAENKQQHADSAADKNSTVSVASKAERNGDHTDRQDDGEYLSMEMFIGKHPWQRQQ